MYVEICDYTQGTKFEFFVLHLSDFFFSYEE